MITEEQLKILTEAMMGDKAAVKLCLDLMYVGHLWDDLVDGDRERSAEEVSKAFTTLVCEINNNPVMLKAPEPVRWQLLGLLSCAAIEYEASTLIEDRRTAVLLAHGYCSFLIYLCYLLGGREHALKYAGRLLSMSLTPEELE